MDTLTIDTRRHPGHLVDHTGRRVLTLTLEYDGSVPHDCIVVRDRRMHEMLEAMNDIVADVAEGVRAALPPP